jgi:hypothetical protein
MKRTSLIALLLLFVASSVVFSQRRKPKSKPKASTPSTKPDKASAVKDEAYGEAIKTWDRYYTKCGDSYHLHLRSGICENRSVSIINRELQLTEADRLNGVKREVRSAFEAKAERCYMNGWSEWHEAASVFVGLIKKSGNWTEEGVPLGLIPIGFIAITPKLSCSEIPGRAAEPEEPVAETNGDVSQIPSRFRLKDEGTSMGSTWSRIDSTTWVENNPDGHSYRFRIVGRARVDGVQGAILRCNPDNLDIFIPDMNSGSVLVKFRAQGNARWSLFEKWLMLKVSDVISVI